MTDSAARMEVYLNGAYLPLSEAKISVLDRAFIFGDGVYEVVPVYGGKPFRLEQHVARLMRTLKGVRIETGKSAEDWKALMTDMARRSPEPDCLVYLQISRGVAKRDHAFPLEPTEPTVFMMASPLVRPSAEKRRHGLRVVSMPDERWLHCDLKTVSLLGNVLAKQHAVEQGVDDVIMFRDGFLTEASSANIWIAAQGKVSGPRKNHLILEGIRYGLMEELCSKMGIPLESRDITQQEVREADEIFITSASKEILPVTELDGRKVGNGEAGRLFHQLRDAYDQLLESL